jgi:FHS family L-fucose permease-like MFS transporter
MKQKRIPLVGEQYLVPFILITSLFFLWGFAHAILDVLNKHFQELLDITKAHSAFIQAMMYMGYFVMAVPAGLFISRFGYRRGVVAAVRYRFVAVYSRAILSVIQYVLVCPFCHRLWIDIP